MKTVVPAVVLLAACTCTAFAAPTAVPPVQAVRATSPIVIDGVLDEPVWQSANPTTTFHQRDPEPGAPGHQKTEIRVAFDDDAIYLGARMYDTAPDSIVAQLARRDVSIAADRVSFYLDPFHDRRTGYYFMVNAAGTMYDGTLSNDGWEDGSWDGVWDAKVKRDSRGWTAEMRIPFSQLRFQAHDQMVWGMNIRRVLPRYNEEDFLIYPPRGESGFVSWWPELHGLDGVHAGRHIEVTPYTNTKAEYLVHEPGDPFHTGSRYRPAAGADIRTSLGNNLTLNATVNPDFGQVEIDPAVVNLTDVETYFQEKRPFFTEGNAIFHTGNNGANDYWNFNWPDPTFFYSRRIGRAPQRRFDDFGYADAPAGTHILGAAKITGQLAPGWNVGTVQAVTAREFADVSKDGVRSRVQAEPLTYYGVFRGMHEFKEGRHGLGVTTTVVGRDLKDPVLAAALDRTAVMSVVDGWAFLDHDKTWVVSGWGGGSHVTGTKDRIAVLQQDSQHYFQRPDASYLHYDPNATSLSGTGARLWLNKQNGAVLANSAIGYLSPGFENNDLGFLAKADFVNAHSGWGYQWNDSNKWRRYANVISALYSSWDMGGAHTQGGLFIGSNLELQNSLSWNGNVTIAQSALSARATRGGPYMQEPRGYGVNAHIDTDSKRSRFYALDYNARGDVEGSYAWTLSPTVTWKPSSNLSIETGPSFERNITEAQYVRTIADAGNTATFGNDYVFARLDQKTAAASIRFDYAVTPALSVQVYAQPLISAGHYDHYRSLAQPRTYTFNAFAAADAGLDPHFLFRTVRGNAVVRWEYHPGSAIFVVWAQTRTGFDSAGDFHLRQSLSDVARVRPDDVFLVKVSRHFEL